MISGINSSGLSLALRTATNARATMDKMTAQIATGKKVASVKDDGAAYVRAAGLNSQLAQIDGREVLISMYKTVTENQNLQNEQSNAAANWMADVIMRAMSYAVGSSARQQLADEWNQAYDSWKNARVKQELTPPLGGLSNGGLGFVGTAQDPITAATQISTLNGTSWWDNGHQTIDYAGNGVPIQTIDVLAGTQTHLSNALSTMRAHLSNATAHTNHQNDAKFLDYASDISSKQRDRIETAISSLTDADLGNASTARANAETRQQLAFNVISNALAQYGKVAGGLLGNVQNTQRGVRA